jgi:predicted nucleotidyltransferase
MFSGFLRQRHKRAQRAAQDAACKRQMLQGLGPLFQRYGLAQVYVFGSVTRSACRSDSDIDIYVEDIEAERYWELWKELEEHTNTRIDLYCQRDDPVFIKKVKERGVLIYEALDSISEAE